MLGESSIKIGEETYTVKLDNSDLKRLQTAFNIKAYEFLKALLDRSAGLFEIDTALTRALRHHEPRLDPKQIEQLVNQALNPRKYAALITVLTQLLYQDPDDDREQTSTEHKDASDDPLS